MEHSGGLRGHHVQSPCRLIPRAGVAARIVMPRREQSKQIRAAVQSPRARHGFCTARSTRCTPNHLWQIGRHVVTTGLKCPHWSAAVEVAGPESTSLRVSASRASWRRDYDYLAQSACGPTGTCQDAHGAGGYSDGHPSALNRNGRVSLERCRTDAGADNVAGPINCYPVRADGQNEPGNPVGVRAIPWHGRPGFRSTWRRMAG